MGLTFYFEEIKGSYHPSKASKLQNKIDSDSDLTWFGENKKSKFFSMGV